MRAWSEKERWGATGRRSAGSPERAEQRPAPSVPPGVQAVLALQRTAGNAHTGRVLAAARGRRLQRMPLKRLTGVPGSPSQHSQLETELLHAERFGEMLVAAWPPGVMDTPSGRAILEEFRRIQHTRLGEAEYKTTLARLRALADEMREARFAYLERSREERGGSVFSNRVAPEIVNEVATFLEAGGGSWAEYNAGRANGFRVTVPVKPADYLRGADPGLLKALKASIGERQENVRAAVATGRKLNWVYATDGTLTIGDVASHHSVVAAGADVWAAGEARLKGGQPAERRTFWSQIERFVSERTGGESARPTIVVNFESGHYRPSEAWTKTREAWESLGFRVEWDPQGRTGR